MNSNCGSSIAFIEDLENLILHLNKDGYTYLNRIQFK